MDLSARQDESTIQKSIKQALAVCKKSSADGYATLSLATQSDAPFARAFEDKLCKNLYQSLSKSFRSAPCPKSIGDMAEEYSAGKSYSLSGQSVYLPFEFNFLAAMPEHLLKNGKSKAQNALDDFENSLPVQMVKECKPTLTFIKLTGFDFLAKEQDRKAFKGALDEFCDRLSDANRAVVVVLSGPDCKGLARTDVELSLNAKEAVLACQGMGLWGKSCSLAATGSNVSPYALVLASMQASKSLANANPLEMNDKESAAALALLEPFLGSASAQAALDAAKQEYLDAINPQVFKPSR